MRVIHVNNVANVGSTLVIALQKIGCDARLRELRLYGQKGGAFRKALALPQRSWELLSTNAEIRRGNFDIVHIHYASLGILGIAGRYDFVLHCHGSDVRSRASSGLRRCVTEQGIRRARLVYFSTPDLADELRDVRPDARFLPNPVDTVMFSPDSQKAKGSNVRVLIISYLHAIKNVRTAFDAAALAQRNRVPVEFTAIANGPEAQLYRDFPGVRFVRAVPHGDMSRLINAHDIVLGQFRIGSLGMSELEGMACGRPVICRYLSSQAYPMQPPVLHAASAEEAANHIAALTLDPDRRRALGEECRRWVCNHHDFVRVAERLQEDYSAIIHS
jgi:glycosyltransferase involved in cell wall biosynthesis